MRSDRAACHASRGRKPLRVLLPSESDAQQRCCRSFARAARPEPVGPTSPRGPDGRRHPSRAGGGRRTGGRCAACWRALRSAVPLSDRRDAERGRRATDETRSRLRADGPSAVHCCTHRSAGRRRWIGRRDVGRGHRRSAQNLGRHGAGGTHTRPCVAGGTHSPLRAARVPRSRLREDGPSAVRCCSHRSAELRRRAGRHAADASHSHPGGAGGTRSHLRGAGGTRSRPREDGRCGVRRCSRRSAGRRRWIGRRDVGRGHRRCAQNRDRHAADETRSRLRADGPSAVHCCTHRNAERRQLNGRRDVGRGHRRNAQNLGRHAADGTHTHHVSGRPGRRCCSRRRAELRLLAGRPDEVQRMNGPSRGRRADLPTAGALLCGGHRTNGAHPSHEIRRSLRHHGPRRRRVGRHPRCRGRGPGRCSSVLGRRSRGLLHQV